jgi:hypothetical protein
LERLFPAVRSSAVGRLLVLLAVAVAAGCFAAPAFAHAASGVLAFRVGPGQSGAGVPRSVLEPESGRPSADNVFAPWLFLGGILVAGGTALFGLLVSRTGERHAAATLTFALSAVVLGGSWLLLTTDVAGTRFGHVTQAAAFVAAGGTFAAAFSPNRPRLLVAAMSASLVLLAAPTLAGHAFRPGSDRLLSVAADLVHVAAAAFWIGGLLQLALMLWSGGDPGAARRFSRLALPAVALIACPVSRGPWSSSAASRSSGRPATAG